MELLKSLSMGINLVKISVTASCGISRSYLRCSSICRSKIFISKLSANATTVLMHCTFKIRHHREARKLQNKAEEIITLQKIKESYMALKNTE